MDRIEILTWINLEVEALRSVKKEMYSKYPTVEIIRFHSHFIEKINSQIEVLERLRVAIGPLNEDDKGKTIEQPGA